MQMFLSLLHKDHKLLKWKHDNFATILVTKIKFFFYSVLDMAAKKSIAWSPGEDLALASVSLAPVLSSSKKQYKKFATKPCKVKEKGQQ